MQKTTRPGEKLRHQAEVNIPMNVVHEIVRYLDIVLDGAPVLIGGRAVNLLCGGESRPSHDIDLVLKSKPTVGQLNELSGRSGTDGTYFTIDGDPNATSRYSINFHSQALEGITNAGWMKIDVYYPGYQSSLNNFKPAKTINSLPINAIVDSAETVQIGDMEFKVASKPMLAVMKYMTWKERGNGNRESKDMQDILKLVRNHYNTKPSFDKFLGDIAGVLDKHNPEAKSEVLEGISRNANPAIILQDIKRAAKFRQRK